MTILQTPGSAAPVRQHQLVQPAILLGLYKYSPDGYASIGLINGIKWDLAYLCFLLLHRHMLQRKGHWGSESRYKAIAVDPNT